MDAFSAEAQRSARRTWQDGISDACELALAPVKPCGTDWKSRDLSRVTTGNGPQLVLGVTGTVAAAYKMILDLAPPPIKSSWNWYHSPWGSRG